MSKGFLYSIIAIVNSNEMRSVYAKDEEVNSWICRCGSNITDTMREILYKVENVCVSHLFIIVHIFSKSILAFIFVG